MSTQACTHVQGSLLLLRLFRATWTRLDHARAVGYRKLTHLQALSLILSEFRHAHRPVSPPHPLGQNCAMQVSPRRLAITRARARVGRAFRRSHRAGCGAGPAPTHSRRNQTGPRTGREKRLPGHRSPRPSNYPGLEPDDGIQRGSAARTEPIAIGRLKA